MPITTGLSNMRPFIPMALAFALFSPAALLAAEPGDAGVMSSGMMMEHCKEMQKEKERLKSDRKMQDAELAALIAQAHAVAEDQQTQKLLGIVTLLFEQRKIIDARTAKMEEKMMAHLMQHMLMGKESMGDCPMMKLPSLDGMVDKDRDHGNLHK